MSGPSGELSFQAEQLPAPEGTRQSKCACLPVFIFFWLYEELWGFKQVLVIRSRESGLIVSDSSLPSE